jgi:hypothetical protein
MVTVGFVVEGASEKYLVESDGFNKLLRDKYGLQLSGVIDAGGNGNMCSAKIGFFVELLKKQFSPTIVVVLADLDPEKCAPCITKRKEIMTSDGIDQIIIARQTLESWFLADTETMRVWLKDSDFYEENPESIDSPWEYLKQIGKASPSKRGPGKSHSIFARKFINRQKFSIERAAEHKNCPSAKYCVEKLKQLKDRFAE